MATSTATQRRAPGLNIFLQVLRVVMGLLFIFSGLVKANDPSGLANKMNEFFEPAVLNLPWLIPHALAFSVFLITCEIVLGVALLLGFAWRFFAWPMLGLNIFFTFLTAYIYYWDVIKHSAKVRECGCFGDCIKISNSETFWKDVILLIIAHHPVCLPQAHPPVDAEISEYCGVHSGRVCRAGIQWWALEHLPFHDCMPFAVGKSICEGMKAPKECIQDSVEMVFVYKHNGKQEDVPMSRIAEIDSTWEYVDRREKVVRKGNGLCDPAIKDFVVNDYSGNNYTDPMLQDPGYKFLLFLKNPATART